MGVLDQIFAGVGGAATGATEQMNVTAELQRRREALAAQRESDINERLYRQDQLARQGKRDSQLAADAAAQRGLTEKAQTLQAARDEAAKARADAEAARRDRVDAERQRRFDERSRQSDRRLDIMEQRASGSGGGSGSGSGSGGGRGKPPALPANATPFQQAEYARLNAAAEANEGLAETSGKVATGYGDQGDAGMRRITGVAGSGLLSKAAAQRDSAGTVFRNVTSALPGAPAPSQPAPAAEPVRDPKMVEYTAAARQLRESIQRLRAKRPGDTARIDALYKQKMDALNAQYLTPSGQ